MAEITPAKGLSLADGLPVALFKSACPGWFAPGFCGAVEQAHSMTAAQAALGIADDLGRSTSLSAAAANRVQAAHPHLAKGPQHVRSQSATVAPVGRSVEFGLTWFAGGTVTPRPMDEAEMAPPLSG